MNRRCASERCHTQIQVFIGAVIYRINGRRRVMNIRNDAQQVFDVQLSGLYGNVGMWVMQPQKGLEVVAQAFGENLPIVMIVEPVNHNPVVSCDFARVGSHELTQLL